MSATMAGTDKLSQFVENASDILRPGNAFNLTRLLATGSPHILSDLMNAAVTAVLGKSEYEIRQENERKENERRYEAMIVLEALQERAAAARNSVDTGMRAHPHSHADTRSMETAPNTALIHRSASPLQEHQSSANHPRPAAHFRAAAEDTGIVASTLSTVQHAGVVARHAAGDAVEYVAGRSTRHFMGQVADAAGSGLSATFHAATHPVETVTNVASAGLSLARSYIPSWVP